MTAGKHVPWLSGILASTLIALALPTGSARAEDAGKPSAMEAWSGKGVETALTARITAYDSCYACTGKHQDDPAFGITRSGATAVPNQTVAVDPNLIPIGSWVYIEGLGVYKAEDTGGAIKGPKVDIYMDTHGEALVFGVKSAKVRVLNLE